MRSSTVFLAGAAGLAAAALAYYTYSTYRSGNPRDTSIYVLQGGGLEVHISAWGATVTKLLVPDASGAKKDVVLGFDTLEPYMDGTSPYFGCVVGRVANRIAKAAFSLDGKKYTLAANNGPNTLHGGVRGFDKVWWKAEPLETPEGQALRLTYTSRDGEEGFPGTCKVAVTYKVATRGEYAFGESSLITEMTATCDKATPISLAQHTYWNLGGHDSGDVLDQTVRLAAKQYTPVDAQLIPTGELVSVKGTPFDFTLPRKLRNQISNVEGGFDHNFVLAAHGGRLPQGVGSKRTLPIRLAASVVDPKTRIAMDLLTDAPGVQFYTGNFLDGSIVGKGRAVYGKHAGLCLETQSFPNAVNQEGFPNTVLKPGETYIHTMVHRFYTQ